MNGGKFWQNAAGRRGAPGAWWRLPVRLLVGTVVASWLAFAAVVLVLRYQVLPDIARYRTAIETLASQAIGLPVRIGGVRAGWEGLRPELLLDDVRVLDRQGAEALSFRHVEAVLAWRSVLVREPLLYRLFADGPTVHAERQADGRVLVAGFQVHPSLGGDPALVDWLLHQRDIVVAGARLIWRDARRPAGAGAEALVFDRVSLHLENRAGRHRFALLGAPPDELAGPLDLRGDFSGRSFADLAHWHGELYLSAPQVDLAAWRRWLDSPIRLSSGRGSLRLWGRLAPDGGWSASADLALADLRLTLSDQDGELPELDLTRFQGRLGVGRQAGPGVPLYHLSGLDLGLALRDGLELPPASFQVQWSPLAPAAGGGSAGVAVATRLDLASVVSLAAYLPVDRATRERLQRYAPVGVVRDFNLTWQGNAERLRRYSATLAFAELGMQPAGLLPGFDGLSGKLVLDERSGQLEIASSPLALEFPAVFPEPRIGLDELTARLGWTLDGGVLEVTLQEAAFSGPDASGSGRGRYRVALDEGAVGAPPLPGSLDLTARVHEADGTAVWRYLPHLIAGDVRQWVRQAVRGGRVRDAEVVLRGPLAEFPFADNEHGQFLIKARVDDGRLLYAPDWPEVAELSTELRFEGDGARFEASQASIAGVRLGKVQATIDRFSAASPRLRINGEAEGPLPGFTRFLDRSPLGEVLGRFYEAMRLTGDGKLRLGLDIPLDRPETARVMGDFDIAGGVAVVDPLLPPVSGLAGRVSFTESTAQANALTGQFFGRPLRVDLRAQGNEVRVAAFGEATAAELQRQYRSPLLAGLAGSLPWQAAVSVRDGQVAFAVQSSLEGLSSTLPEPFRKQSDETLAVRFSRNALSGRAAAANTARSTGKGSRPAKAAPEVPRDELRLEIGQRAGATLIRRLDGATAEVERGIVAVGEQWARQPLPDKGLKVVVVQPQIDLDQWRAAWNAGSVTLAGTPAPVSVGVHWPVPEFDLKADTLRLISRQWRDVTVRAMPAPGGIGGHIVARDMAGAWSWENAGKGTLHARLTQMTLPDTSGAGNGGNGHANGTAVGDAATEVPDDLPALNVIVEQLVLGERQLGWLEIQAENAAGSWRVPRFKLTSPDGDIVGKGVWRPATAGVAAATEVDVAVNARDVGKLLVRFGYPDAMRRGEGSLDAQLAWQGVPTAIHLPTLGGRLVLRGERGQFNKLEPGIGKLLSLLSLQMLPRRITLDFRDVFSDGFAFEKITGDVRVSRGDLVTDNLEIEGSAARVMMKGDADLASDRVNARVTVYPELGSTLAIGATVAAGPVAGVAALLAQKLFNRAFAFDYDISGPLSDPRIERVGQTPALPSGDVAPDRAPAGGNPAAAKKE